MKLFGSFTSPFVRHCRIVLMQNQHAFDFVPADYATSATQTPTKRVPYFENGDVRLTDSSSIIRYLRGLAAQPFCTDAADYDLYCMASTGLDTEINLFLLERDGFTPEQVSYLARQRARVEAILTELDQRNWASEGPYSDGQIRLGCWLSWALFRQRLDLTPWPNLMQFLAALNNQSWFANTHPALG